MAGHRDLVGKVDDDLRYLFQHLLGVAVHVRRSQREHGEALLIDDLDAQTLGGLIDDEAVGEPAEFRRPRYGVAQRLLGGGEHLFLALGEEFVEFLFGEVLLVRLPGVPGSRA